MPRDAEDLKSVLADAAECVPCWQPKLVEFKSLEGGRTNHNFIATANGLNYIVRIGTCHASELGVDRVNEIAAWRAASGAGIAPQILWVDHERHIVVSDFVEGRHWLLGEILRADNLARLTQALRALHALQITATPFDAYVQGSSFEQRCGGRDVPRMNDQKWRKRVSAVMEHRSYNYEPRVCHNDLGRGNFIDDGTRLWLIDWECAGMGDPYYDLAVVAHSNRLTPSQEVDCIQAYGGRLMPGDMARLARMKVAHDFYHIFWYAHQIDTTPTPDDFKRCSEFHASRLETELTGFRDDGSYDPDAVRPQE